MKKKLALIFAIVGWVTLTSRLTLSVLNGNETSLITVIRFFSYFTVLTNMLVAIYFTNIALKNASQKNTVWNKAGTLTALATLMTLVAIVYHIMIAPSRNITGLPLLLSSILHTWLPIAIVVFWYRYENMRNVRPKQLLYWLLYPTFYTFYVLLKGYFSGFYPYFFFDITTIGLQQVIVNLFWLLLTISAFLGVFFLLSKRIR